MSNEVWNLLEQFDILEIDIRKCMVIYDREIISGINVVREIINEINLENVDSEFKNCVMFKIKQYEQDNLSKMKITDNYMMYGISRCLRIIDGVIRVNNRNKKKLVRKICDTGNKKL